MGFVGNRYLDAFLKLMILSATIHILALLIMSIITNDMALLNFFSIIDLNLIFPWITEGVLRQLIGFEFMVLTYLGIFIFFTSNDRKKIK